MGLPAPPSSPPIRRRLVPVVQYDKELSTGAVGSIWLGRMAQGLELGRLVTVRRVPSALLNDRTQERLRQVARVCVELQHPTLVKQLGTCEADGEWLSISEHLQGVLLYDLRRYLVETQTPLPTAVAVRIIRDAARAGVTARALAQERIVFQNRRILYNDSIVVAAFGETFLRDTGVLTEICDSPQVIEIPGVVAGLSPEELSGPRVFHEASEVFSLGVLLWELLANRTLFSRKSLERATSSVISQPVPQLDRVDRIGLPVPKELVILVCRAIDRDPRRRIPSLEDLADAIDELPPHLIGSSDQVGNCIRRLAGGFLGEPSHSSCWSIRAKSDSLAIEVSQTVKASPELHNWEPETVSDRSLIDSSTIAVAKDNSPPMRSDTCDMLDAELLVRPRRSRRSVAPILVGVAAAAAILGYVALHFAWIPASIVDRYQGAASRYLPAPLKGRTLDENKWPSQAAASSGAVVTGTGPSASASANIAPPVPEPEAEPATVPSIDPTSEALDKSTRKSHRVRGESRLPRTQPKELDPVQRWGI